jgi:hypothetical protein
MLNKIFRHLESSVITFSGLGILQSVSRVSDLEGTILSEEIWAIFVVFIGETKERRVQRIKVEEER